MADRTGSAHHMRLRQVEGILSAYAYRFGSEVQLHERLAQVLGDAGVSYVREKVLDARNRADFWLDGIVIEVKIDGSLPEALAQVGRYINLPDVHGVLLASTKHWAAQPLRDRPKWHGKPFAMAYIRRQAL